MTPLEPTAWLLMMRLGLQLVSIGLFWMRTTRKTPRNSNFRLHYRKDGETTVFKLNWTSTLPNGEQRNKAELAEANGSGVPLSL